jgi:ankyrin repeat protein
MAAAGGHAETITCLLEAGAQFGAVDGTGASTAAVAAATGCCEGLQLLLEAGAAAAGVSSSCSAAAADRQWWRQQLLAIDATGLNLLHMAAYSGSSSVWEYCMRQLGLSFAAAAGSHDNHGSSSSDAISSGPTAAAAAAAADVFAAAGASKDGRTLLHFAALSGSVQIVEHVLSVVQQQQQGADAAASKSSSSICRWVHTAANGGRLAWHMAAERVSSSVCQGMRWLLHVLHCNASFAVHRSCCCAATAA